MPSGIDTMCVVVHESTLEGKKEKLVQRIHELCSPDTVEIHSGLALIATVGRGMVRSKGISARLFNALMKAGVNVRLIDQGSSELNIIVGVDNLDFEVATRAIYRAFDDKGQSLVRTTEESAGCPKGRPVFLEIIVRVCYNTDGYLYKRCVEEESGKMKNNWKKAAALLGLGALLLGLTGCGTEKEPMSDGVDIL